MNSEPKAKNWKNLIYLLPLITLYIPIAGFRSGVQMPAAWWGWAILMVVVSFATAAVLAHRSTPSAIALLTGAVTFPAIAALCSRAMDDALRSAVLGSTANPSPPFNMVFAFTACFALGALLAFVIARILKRR